jgi:hypothetical protein
MNWKPDWMLRALLAWTAVTTLPFWLPLVRSVMDGDSYEWGFFAFRGHGLRGDLWLPAICVTLALAIRRLGWRGARPPFHALLLLWLIPIGAGATYLSIARPEDFTFRGDTMGLSIPLAPVGILLFGGFAVLAVFWVVRDLRSGRRREAPPWTRTNTTLVSGLLALLPIQFILLRFGEPHGTTDKIGVVVTIVQWLLVGTALRPRVPAGGASRPLPDRGVGPSTRALARGLDLGEVADHE